VVRAASGLGLKALAITDHDTMSALPIARPEAERAGLELIGGIEVTTQDDGRELHLLGLFVRDDDPALLDRTRLIKAARAQRLREMVERLRELGLSVDLDALTRTFPRATLGRRHLAEFLVRTGQVADHHEAFARYLGDRGPARVAKPRVPRDEAIALIGGAGGVAVLAHPPYDLKEATLRELQRAGLRGLEVDWPGLAPNKSRRWREAADRLGLIPTAGSDFHAPDRHGRWLGAVATPLPDLEQLRAACLATT
jgi:hypothetical protein